MSVEEFMKSPSVDLLLTFKKDDLLAIGKRLELEVARSMRKANLVRLIAEHMVANDVLPEEVMDQLPPPPLEMSQAQLELENTRIMVQAETERAKAQAMAQIEKARIEADALLQKARIDQDIRLKELADKQACDEARRNEFDLPKQVRLVPPFNEAEIDMYFQHFEKVAASLKWPKAMRPMLLQTVLKGKAQEAYAALPVIDCFDYNKVKSAILKAYELVPEAYRQRFSVYR